MPEVLYITEPRKIEIHKEPEQKLGPEQARAKMLYSGISHGTEMNTYSGRIPGNFPCRSGYSAVGEIVEVGSEFTKASVGDRIFHYASHATEFVISESQPVYLLPEGLDTKCGIFTALAGVAYNGVLESQIALGETAVVFGLGVVGLCTSFLIRKAGAFNVIAVDPVSIRREAGKRMGVDATLDPNENDIAEQVKALNGGQLADVVIETSGAISALNDALKAIQNQSMIVPLSWYSADAAGLDLSKDFHYKRVKIQVAQGGSVPLYLSSRWTYDRRVRSTMKVMPEMPLSSLVTHTIPFAEAQEAYELVNNHPEQCIQVILEY
jgi:2-desacetyl-2-hydroxyethyl bacteriochlorophyllide A dehydrogenase